MAIPTYEDLMLPLMLALADGEEHAVRDTRDEIARSLSLTSADRAARLPSGKQAVFDNRVGWAKTYLAKAGLVDAPRRGVYQLTTAGLALMKTRPDRISNATLAKYESFRDFYVGDVATAEELSQQEGVPSSTPREQLETAYRQLRRDLEQELLSRVLRAPPQFFEQLVVDLLVRMGYGGTVEDAGEALGRSGDGGIDGIIKEDVLGLDAVYVQAKRWQNTVGRPDVQAFAGSLEGERARKGVFITTSGFSRDAREYVGRIDKKIVLIDGRQLASLMFVHNVGVTGIASFELKRVDSDYFEDE